MLRGVAAADIPPEVKLAWLRKHVWQAMCWHVWASLSKPVERSGVYFASPTDMFITCLKNWHAQWPARRNKWFGSGGPLPCLSMFKQTCWELWSVLHMAHWHVYILFDRLTCTMTCQVKQMIGIVSCAKVAWQKLQTKVQSTSWSFVPHRGPRWFQK